MFLAIGHRPNTAAFDGWLARDEKGYLVVAHETHSEIEGVFIAGDVHDHRYRQAVTAAGDGCRAAIDAERWLEEHGSVEAADRGGLVSDRREATLRRLGLAPSAGDLVRAALDGALDRAEAARLAQGAAPPAIVVLDAGCGRSSALARYRARIGRFVGVDIHEPAPGALPYLDEFATVDLCANADAFRPNTFDLVLSSFTVEHFADPGAAFANLAAGFGRAARSCSRPSTAAIRSSPPTSGCPTALRRRIQPLVKASAADAHPLVGACNDPAELRERARRGPATSEIRHPDAWATWRAPGGGAARPSSSGSSATCSPGACRRAAPRSSSRPGSRSPPRDWTPGRDV